MSRTLPLIVLWAGCLACSGCLFVVEEPEPTAVVDEPVVYESTPPNQRPVIFPESTAWWCEFADGDYAFDFETEVDDSDGLGDIDTVEVTVLLAGTGHQIDEFLLFDEGFGRFGARVWESESNLYCGEPIDVRFEVWDWAGEFDAVVLWY